MTEKNKTDKEKYQILYEHWPQVFNEEKSKVLPRNMDKKIKAFCKKHELNPINYLVAMHRYILETAYLVSICRESYRVNQNGNIPNENALLIKSKISETWKDCAMKQLIQHQNKHLQQSDK